MAPKRGQKGVKNGHFGLILASFWTPSGTPSGQAWPPFLMLSGGFWPPGSHRGQKGSKKGSKMTPFWTPSGKPPILAPARSWGRNLGFLAIFGQKGVQKGVQKGSKIGHFWPFLSHFGPPKWPSGGQKRRKTPPTAGQEGVPEGGPFGPPFGPLPGAIWLKRGQKGVFWLICVIAPAHQVSGHFWPKKGQKRVKKGVF